MTAPQTLAQKLVARAAGRTQVTPGEIVTCRVDLAMFHDTSGPRRLKPMLAELGAHDLGQEQGGARHRPLRAGGRRRIAPHRAHRARLGGRAGAAACLRLPGHLPRRACRSTGTCGRACSASAAIRIRPPAARSAPTCSASAPPRCSAWWSPARSGCRCRRPSSCTGAGGSRDGVSAKDMMLAMLGRFGMNGGALPGGGVLRRGGCRAGMAERMTLSNMSAELGAQVGLVAPDATTRAWLAAHGVAADALTSTPLAQRRRRAGHAPRTSTHRPWRRRWRCRTARPTCARSTRSSRRRSTSPTSAPAPAPSSKTCAPRRACSRGHRIAPGVQLLVAPASVHDRDVAEREGMLRRLLDAGATLLPSACGACAGYGSAFPTAAP